MQINWDISQEDIDRLQAFLQQHDNHFVRRRISRNINRQGIQLDSDTILKNLIMCLLTTQQRSGPNTPVGIFLRQNPFPLTVHSIGNNGDIKQFIRTTLQQNNLTRFTDRISAFFENIYNKIRQDNWTFLNALTQSLNGQADRNLERQKADELREYFLGNGIGLKQSRNFLQALGLTKFEIPIDSRITSWFNDFGFPVTLSPTALQDRGYYHFVSDGIQLLCDKAEIFPCVLDAAIFSSFDDEQWTEETAIF